MLIDKKLPLKNKKQSKLKKDRDIAVIGMACRFPGADNYDEFWVNLSKGKDCISEIPPDRWDWRKYYGDPQKEENKTNSKWGGFINDVDKFDAGFFKISNREAEQMDPQQRILMEETWHCIEDSGVPITTLQNSKTAVIVGAVTNDYHLLSADSKETIDTYAGLGNYKSVFSNRISFFFDFNGPSISTDAACASSLVAIYEAKQKLNNGECDFAIVAATNLILHPFRYISFAKSRMLSPDGRCKTFDQSANGYVPGEGIGVILLCRKEYAVKAGKRIYGVIKGAAINHSGELSTITAPKVEAQKDVIISALEDGGIKPSDVSYVEAHGTGTSLGDPIEIEALKQAYKSYTDEKEFCYIGSVKSNIGHLEGAAGMAGVIKVLLMMRAKEIPETINITHPNPLINFKETPFVLSRTKRIWKPDFTEKMIAGVSSFGFSGVNAHVIIENYSLEEGENNDETEPYVFGLSAKSKPVLDKMVENWKDFYSSHKFSDRDISFVSHSCMANKMGFSNRMGGVVYNQSDILKLLNDYPQDNYKTMECYLHIGDLKLSGMADIDPSIIKAEGFKEGIKICLKKLNKKKKKKYLDEIYRLQWRENKKDFFTTIVTYAYLHLLNISGVVFKQISGSGKGFYSALLASRMVEFADCYKIKKGLLKWLEVEIKRPNIPFYDLESENTIYPFRITQDYFRYLLENATLNGDDLDFCINKAKELIKHQFTFKKMIDDWDNVTKGKIKQFLENPPERKSDREILAVAIISSLERINRKWTLSNNERHICKSIAEWVKLIVYGFITEKEFIDLIESPQSDMTVLCRNVNGRMLENNDICKDDFVLLYERFNTLCEIRNTDNWIDRQSAFKGLYCPEDKNVDCFVISGEYSYKTAENVFVCDFKSQLKKVLFKFWIKGQDIQWEKIYKDEFSQSALFLPSYPFTKNSFWIDLKKSCVNVEKIHLHPLAQENVSTLLEQRFNSVFDGKEFFLTDHRVKEQKVLPGVAYLEMVRAAAAVSSKENVVEISNIIWSQPVVVAEKAKTISVGLYLESGLVSYEIFSEGSQQNEDIVYSQGKLKLSVNTPKQADKINPGEIERLLDIEFDKEKCYQSFNAIGLNYGPAFQSIESLRTDGRLVLAKLKIPENVRYTLDSFELHPSLFDGALQSVMGLSLYDSELPTLQIPYAMDKLHIFGKIPETAFALVKKQESKKPSSSFEKYDIKIANEAGEVVLDVQGFSMLPVGKLEREKTTSDGLTPDVIYAKSVWKGKPSGTENSELLKNATIFTTSIEPEKMCILKKEYPEYHIEELYSGDDPIDILVNKRFNQVFSCVKRIVSGKEKENHYIVIIASDSEPEFRYDFLSGLLKSVSIETPRIKGKILTISPETLEKGSSFLACEFMDTSFDSVEVKYGIDNNRMVRMLEEVDVQKTEDDHKYLIKERGIYLITGGMGGLGRIFAKYILEKAVATVILTGRSDLDDKKMQYLEELNKHEGKAVYLPCDITSKSAVEMLIKTIKNEYGDISGVIHGAGVIQDSLVMKKTREEIDAVLLPKVSGIVNIDEATQSIPLDFMVLFSSLAGVLGNMGQTDYASANAFLDAYSVYRNELTRKKLRSGKTISINWPLWKDGGMQVDKSSLQLLKSRWGMEPLPLREGISAFNYMLDAINESGLVVYGNSQKFREAFLHPAEKREAENEIKGSGNKKAPVNKKDPVNKKAPEDLNEVKERTVKELVHICEDLLRVPAKDLDVDTEFFEYGLDSILMMQLLNNIEGKYNEALTPETVINCPTISQLADYLIDNNIVKNKAFIAAQDEVAIADETTTEPDNYTEKQHSISSRRKLKDPQRFMADKLESGSKKVAVIGISGRFPNSPDLESYWDNLVAGKELISEVPLERFDISQYYDADKNAECKTYVKWAGFMEQVDQFDAGFFGISDTDAIVMDPQHRILLELTQELWDRSGYKKEEVNNRRISVFIGGAEGDYHDIYGTNLPNSYMKYFITNSITNMMAARISDFYNLRGTSYTLDTACSSSLVAIHQAVISIQNKESEMAIAGGVQILIGPKNFIGFSKASVLSETGRSYVFDKRADGFVLGEGAGLVLLKDYEAALRDGDQILGVILGSAVNNDGHTMGLTTPNPEAQKEVVEMALMEAGINPETIELYEAHGTGTLLGDPIEIKAMKDVYGKLTDKKGYCAVGSVKSNAGHMLRAAGVASFIKLILAMQHNEKPKTLNCETPHPRFKFDESPFYPITSNEKWKGINGIKRAALSSFGFGGTNCHIILESGKQADGEKVRKPLPKTLFSRKKYWLGRDIVPVKDRTFYSGEEALLIYQRQYGYKDYLLKDHQIYEKRVLIGMAFVAQFYQCMIMNASGKSVFLNRTIFFAPLNIDRDNNVEVKTKGAKFKDASFELECSFHNEHGETVVAATNAGFFEKGQASVPSADVLELFENSVDSLSPELFYANPKQNMYRESLFSLKAIRKVSDGVIGKIELSDEIRQELKELVLNPAILDAGHNLTLFLDVLDTNEICFSEIYLPLMIKKTYIYSKQLSDKTVYCLAKKVKETSEIKEYNLEFYNSDNHLMVYMEGFTRKRLSDAEKLINPDKEDSVQCHNQYN